MTRTRNRIDKTAIDVMRELDRHHIWYGDPDLIGEVAERAGAPCAHSHPLNRSAAVMRAICLSPLFERTGYIRHLSRRYPIYRPISSP